MKFFLSVLLILCLLSGNAQSGGFEFPDQIQTTRTDKHVRVLGTKVFGLFPTEYQYIKEVGRYQKNEKLYVQITNSNASNFVLAKTKMTRTAFEEKGAIVDVLKNIRLNEFEAVYMEGPSKEPGETKLGLFFGDETFVVMVVGVFKSSDSVGKKELQAIFKSIYYDNALQIDPLELADFSFDQSITNFKYSMTATNAFMYAENGKNDAQNPTANSILIMVLPEMTLEQVETYANNMPSHYERRGIMLENKKATRTDINSHPSFVLESKITYGDKKGVMYQVVLVGEKSIVFFMATAYSDLVNYLDKYKRTVETLKIN